MATAKKVPKEEFDVQLILSKEEAIYLMKIVGNVTGGGKARAVYADMFNKLDNLKIDDNLYQEIGYLFNNVLELKS